MFIILCSVQLSLRIKLTEQNMKCTRTFAFIENFTPNWFATTMGTGITAIGINTLSNYFAGLSALATGIWIFNIGLFLFFTIVMLAQILLYPKSWQRILHHSSQGMFLGCIPMGLMTIVNGFVFFGLPLMGDVAIQIGVVLWWVDVVLSVLSILIVPYYMFTHQEHALENMTAVWLLPFVACEVAAAGGALLLPHLVSADVLTILFSSLVLWSMSVSLALSILVIFFYRLCIHKLPPKDLAASIWLPLGPTGTGGMALLLLGHNAGALATTAYSPSVVNLIQLLPGVGLLIGTVFWALASWWLMIALIATIHYLVKSRLKFNLGFWAYTFPLGVYSMATVNLGLQTGLTFFIVYGWVLVTVLSLIFLCLFIRTFLWGLLFSKCSQA